MFGRMTVGKRIALGFTTVLVLLAVIGGLSVRGVRGLSDGLTATIGTNGLVQNLLDREVDHFKWANAVAELLTNDAVTSLQVETDDHKCALGKWLYGEGRQEAEAAIPELVPILKSMEEPHAKLHASAIDIGKVFRQADAELPGRLAV
ncbi:MAG: CZB domain-containing protein, partial [Planctomycetes bacterium]|nr:CZB domain-containing protein [Planctomycetota bacterium]